MSDLMIETPAAARKSLLTRMAAFIAVTSVVWGGYYWWRPPAPMLGLHHVEHLPPSTKEVCMTFDDAPHPLTTPLLLAALKGSHIHGSFMCVGNNLMLYPELARRMVEDGHHLADHSQYHHNLTTVTPAEYDHEVETCFKVISADHGQPTSLFRPPGGGLNRSEMQYLYDHHVTLAWWSSDVGDYAIPDAWAIASGVIATLRPGDILLLHDELASTPKAVPLIAKEAFKRGYTFVPMPESAPLR